MKQHMCLLASKAMKTARGICVSRMVLARFVFFR